MSIAETAENFDYWLQREYLNESTRTLMGDAEVLMVPDENLRPYETPLFTGNFLEVYDMLNENLKVEAAINDEDFREIALNSRVHRYGKFVVMNAVIPVFIGLLTNYIYDQLKHEDPKDEIELEIVVQADGGEAISVKYQGTAKDFNTVGEKVKEIARTGHHEHRTDSAGSAAQVRGH